MLVSAGLVSAANRFNERYAARAYYSKQTLGRLHGHILRTRVHRMHLSHVRSTMLYNDSLLFIPEDLKPSCDRAAKAFGYKGALKATTGLASSVYNAH